MHGIVKGYVLDEVSQIGQRAEAEGLAKGMAEAGAMVIRAQQERVQLEERALMGLLPVLKEAVRRVVGQALDQLPEAILEEALRQAWQALGPLADRQQNLSLRVPLGDGEVARRLCEAMLPKPVTSSMDVVEDGSVEPGGCILEAGPLWADARIETRLDLLMQILEGDL